MKTENFERVKAIEKEIANLVEYKRPLETNRGNIRLKVRGEISPDQYSKENTYNPYYDCPAFLKEQLLDDLNFIADRMLAKINKRIAELEKEFESL